MAGLVVHDEVTLEHLIEARCIGCPRGTDRHDLFQVPATEHVGVDQRFAQLAPALQEAYFGAVLFAAAATLFLVAPSVHHRVQWRDRDKERLLKTANRLTIIGTVCLAAAIVLALYVITDVLFTTNLAVLTGIAALVLFGVLWYVVPMVGRSPSSEEEGSGEDETGGEQDQESRGASSRR